MCGLSLSEPVLHSLPPSGTVFLRPRTVPSTNIVYIICTQHLLANFKMTASIVSFIRRKPKQKHYPCLPQQPTSLAAVISKLPTGVSVPSACVCCVHVSEVMNPRSSRWVNSETARAATPAPFGKSIHVALTGDKRRGRKSSRLSATEKQRRQHDEKKSPVVGRDGKGRESKHLSLILPVGGDPAALLRRMSPRYP